MRGILMIEPLYHQTVAGKKTMTRRSGGLEKVNHKPDLWWLYQKVEGNVLFRFNQTKQRNSTHPIEAFCKARYKIGEVLYMKEPSCERTNCIGYKYDLVVELRDKIKWQNKLFMPATAARVFIRITGIKCERLLDISDEDCIAEGIKTVGSEGGLYGLIYKNYMVNESWLLTPKSSFISLFKFANKIKNDADIDNPWVWVYSYEYLKDYKL